MARRQLVPRPAALPRSPVADAPALAAGVRPLAAALGRHRRPVAAVCAGAAVVVAVSALTPSPSGPETGAGRPGGATSLLGAGAGAAPVAGADRVAVAVRLADAAGLLLLRPGSHAELLAGPTSEAGPAVASTEGEVLAPDAVVLAVPAPPALGSSNGAAGPGVSGMLGSSGAGSGGLDGVVVLAVPPPDARRIAAAAGARALSVAVAVGAAG